MNTFLMTSLTTHTVMSASSTAIATVHKLAFLAVSKSNPTRVSTRVKLGALGTLNRVCPTSARSRCRQADCPRRCCRQPMQTPRTDSPQRVHAPRTRRRDAVAQVVADHPRFVAAWAALGDAAATRSSDTRRTASGITAVSTPYGPMAGGAPGTCGGSEPTNVGFLRCSAGLAGDGVCDRGARRGRALRAVLAAARPVRPTHVTQPSIGGAVLCGGRSARFGRDKALVHIDGQPMAEQVARVVESAGCSPVVFVGGVGDRALGLRAAVRSSLIRGQARAHSARLSTFCSGSAVETSTASWSRRAICPSSASTPCGPLPANAARRWPSPNGCIRRWPAGRPRRPTTSSGCSHRGCAHCTRRSRCSARYTSRCRPQRCTTPIVRRILPTSGALDFRVGDLFEEVPVAANPDTPTPSSDHQTRSARLTSRSCRFRRSKCLSSPSALRTVLS